MVIISDGGFLVLPDRTDHNHENSVTGYDHRIPASTFLPFSRRKSRLSRGFLPEIHEIIALGISFCLFN
jgi:hypothetical protein